MKILFGIAELGARGGINSCEPPFIEAARGLVTEAVEEVYLFDNSAKTGFFKRVSNVRSAAAALREHILRSEFDVIHLNTSFELKSLFRDAYTLRAIRHPRVFLKFHGSDPNLLSARNPLVSSLVRYVLGRAAGIGVLSSEERDAFVAAGAPSAKVHLVKNAVAPPAPDGFPHVEKSGGDPFQLLFVSRLVPTKGLEDTVRALKILTESGAHAVLDVLGGGEARSGAEKLTMELGLSDRIRFHGHVGEKMVRDFYRRSDALVFPTFHDEGFPMVVFNALGFGLPIVTTRIRAAADYLEEGVNALFCRAKDPADVAERLGAVIADERLRRDMARANRELAQAFAPPRVAAEYMDIYRGMIN